MKKLLAIAIITLFTAALAAPSAFAFGGDCGKANKGTKTAEETAPNTTKA